ncbi:hypothetical protein GC209_02185 [bacterium]|nr:hypothetical protein [bacterium]
MTAADDPLGPYERWMFGPGKAYDLPGLQLDASPGLSCLAEFGAPLAHPAQAVTNLLTADGITMLPRLPTLWPGVAPRFLPLLLLPENPTAIAAHDPSRLAALLDGLGGGGARHLRLNYPVRSETIDASFPLARPAEPPAPGVDPARPLVILAVIDHGIAFAHQALRAHGATRVDYCWSQSATADNAGAVLFGREFTRSAIEALRSAHAGDEEAIYRAAGLLGRPGLPPMPLARAHSHGAHVLGTAAALPPEDAAQVRIVAVDLPSTSIWDTSGFGSDMFLLAGMHYIFDRASRIAAAHGRPEAPLVVNISMGWSGGPHDGSAAIEAALAELIAARRSEAATTLTLPTGNMYQDMLSARIEDSQFAAAPDGKAEAGLRWYVQPEDMTSTFAEIWLAPGADPAGHSFSLTAPDGTVTSIGPLPGHVDVTVGGKTVGQITLDQYRKLRWRVTICLAPSAPKALPGPPHAGAPAGLWRLTLRRTANLHGPVWVRVQRDVDHEQGHTGARQSWLIDPAYDRYASDGALAQVDDPASGAMLRRMDGLNGLATQALSLNVAGHVASLSRAAEYSSAGPLDGPAAARGVDVSAPTDRSPAHTGIVSTGTRTGSFVALQGTSSAAPQIARELALAFLAGPPAPGPAPDNYASALAARPGVVPVPDTDPGPTGRARLGVLRLT